MSLRNHAPRPCRSLRVALVAAIAALTATLAAPVAQAAFEDYALESVEAGLSTSQAGAHADVRTKFTLASDVDGTPFARTKDVSVELPPGMLGDPTAYPRCSEAQFQVAWESCPFETQVGVARVRLAGFQGTVTEPIFNLETPNRSTVARLGFVALVYPTFIDLDIRSESDYGVTATVAGASGQANLISVETTLWGNPADPSHDGERLSFFEAFMCGYPCNAPNGTSRPSNLEPAPFMTNPTRCGPAPVRFTAVSYPRPDLPSTASTAFPDITGCDKLSFDAGMSVKPSSRAAASPTGLDLEIDFTHNDAVNTLANSHMRDARVTLPEGMTVAAGSANGLEACSAEDVRAGTRESSACPAASRIGSASFDVPGLPEKLEGGVYLRSPEPGKLLRLWLVADDLGVHLKVPGEIEADPVTARLTTVFTDNPQTPLRSLKMHLKGGPYGVLTNPRSCGEYETTAELAPWSGQAPVTVVSPMSIDEGCDTGGFAPGFEAGATSPVAGPFDLGTVLVRAGVYVDPVTAQLTVASDRMPRILAGIPLNLRDVRIAVDRGRFTINPTSCRETEVAATIRAQDGAAVARSTRYQAGECRRLALSPRMGMRLAGARHTREGGNPALRVALRQPPSGQANISRVRVVLPKSLALDPENANDAGLLCPYESGLAGDCPASSVIGSATAVSPLLKRPLRGKVHFVQGVRFDKRTGARRRTLPTLLVKLRGEITLDLRAKTSVSKGGQLVSTFPVVPDAKISSFRLSLKGGNDDGILTVSGRPELCQGAQRAAITYGGHNGRTHRQTVAIKTPCRKKNGP
jgi:hypothetical protein